MVDVNKKLPDEIESQLELIGSDTELECRVRFKDDGDELDVIIALHGYDEERDRDIDDRVFYYCDSLNDFRALLDEETSDDFTVIAFSGTKASWN